MEKLTENEYRLMKKIQKSGRIRANELSPEERVTFLVLIEKGYVEELFEEKPTEKDAEKRRNDIRKHCENALINFFPLIPVLFLLVILILFKCVNN